MLGDSADKHWQEIQALEVAHSEHGANHNRMSKELESLESWHGHHPTMEDMWTTWSERSVTPPTNTPTNCRP